MIKDHFSSIHDDKSPPTYKYFNGEKWLDSKSGDLIDVISPIDNSILGRIFSLTTTEIKKVADLGREAQKEWRETATIKRSRVLHLVSDWLRSHEDFFTTLIVKEIGKPFTEAKEEVIRSADMIERFAQAVLNMSGEELSGESFPGYDKSKTAIVEKVPLGVVLAVSPFNYPLNLAVSKIAPALANGNSVIFKPATQGSITGLCLTEVFRLAGLPKGVLVTLTGNAEKINEYLLSQKYIDMIAFTGSSSTGEKIAAKAGMTPCLFELGGNNGAIVLPEAEMEETATELVKGAFSYSGQRCTAVKYVLALEPTLEKLIPKVIKKTKEIIKMGDPRNSQNNFGPMISEMAANEVEKRIYLAKAAGARILSGGKREGRYIEPTILDKVSPSMEIVETETFGPVLCFIKADSIKEAISIINNSGYGLQSCVFTEDEGSAIEIARQLETGSVQINGKPQRGPDNFPFLGIKKSGVGVQGIRYSLEAMIRLRPIVLNKPH